ncbi:TcdA/TcdB pore-forming domain-containing protein [Pseudomonas sp. dw_612]|uniref:TcdA/TcdB pore-forming domain-containing protein n=1 Tax=Pseudomonas sp. dw_612 TaxID=2720080 RepID=UPI0021169498|nr:TcdA/TcdB pore-forming domain-containing protein [Pseudomonas sp. dw_612]
MSPHEVVSGREYVGIADLLSRSELERILAPYKKTDQYDAILRYYQGCIDAQNDQALLRPLVLLQESLNSLVPPLRRRRETDEPLASGEAIFELHQKVSDYGNRVAQSVETLKSALPSVPKKLHFVWLGGGVGDIQRDYINVWKQVMSKDGHTLMLWYDADALLAYETNRIIVQAAKADAMATGGAKLADPIELGNLYIERLMPLKEQLYTHLRGAQERGESADEARIDLLVRAYGQDEQTLRALRDKHVLSMSALESKDLVLRDLQRLEQPLRTEDIYQREINLRGNFAAASDLVRAEALSIEGGAYTDVDNLPPLMEHLGGVDISAFADNARLEVLQLLLEHNPEWMPGRVADRYKKFSDTIPPDKRAVLEAFAKSRPALNDVFHAPENLHVRPDGLRAVAVGGTVSNAFMIAHPGSATLDAVIDRFLINYEVVKTTARKAIEQNVSHSDFPAMTRLALAAAVEQFGPLEKLTDMEAYAIEALARGAADYYSDGLYPGSENTIFLTGPVAMIEGIGDYEKSNLTPRTAEELRQLIAIKNSGTVNRQTEEELDHSWKENESNSAQWLIDEKKRWQEGRFAARYNGDVTQLLKRQTIDFEAGWPVVEGRHVLSTRILQQLLDHLGEPFLRAMSRGGDTSVTFDKRLPLDFDDRQAIIGQDVRSFPPIGLGDATTWRLSSLEVFEQLASGSLLLEQLSAAQRLLLGQLLGLDSLDNRSFETVTGELDNLARKVSEKGLAGRYAVIEEQLFKYKASEFVAGLASPVEEPTLHGANALLLKYNAMEKPLSLRQWGQHVSRIQHMAKTEFRERLAERSGELMGSFSEGEASFVPQDLLFDGFGDTIGRRCYPLVLAMAAAVANGKAAVTALRERFYLSVLAPEDSNSQRFVHAIEALHGVEMGEGGTAPRVNLQRVVALLEARTTTSTLMLNSDNHAMLVAKTWVGDRSTYHFYDPNLGIFEFANPEGMLSDLSNFFVDMGMADYYSAYGERGQPTFDLVEVQSEQIAQLELSSGVRVENMLVPGTLKGPDVASSRKRLASARGQSLLSNPRLGKSLMELDSHWWGQQITQASSDLQAKNQLTSDFIPLFETLEINPRGDYQLSLIKPEKNGVPEQLVRVTTEDQRFLRIKNHLSELFDKLTTRRPSVIDPTHAGAVHTLNSGFAVQALMNALRGGEGEDRNLTLAVRLHAYVNYAQIVHGLVSDIAGVVSLVRQGLAQERLIAQTSSTVAGEALGHVAGEGVGTLLGLVNVGFDIYQLNQADNDVDVARFGTQLAFDSASVVLGAAGLGAGLASAATAAAFLGGASVIVGGLAIGVAALAQGFATLAERSKQVGLFFDELDHAYRGAPFHWSAQQNAWQAHPKLVIQSLNLRDGVVTYDSQRLFPLRDHFGVPDYEADYDRAINLRQSLGLPDSGTFRPAAGEVIILPCTPRTFYGYDYTFLPGATNRHDKGFDIVRRLEKKNPDGTWQFMFTFWAFPGEYIVKGIYPAYRPHTPTLIQIKLDDVPRTLVVPTLLKNWHGQIAYEIEVSDAPGTLMLNQGVNVLFKSSSFKTLSWTLLATWAQESDVRFMSGGALSVGGVNVAFRGEAHFEVTLHLSGNNGFRVDHRQQALIPLEVDALPGTDAQALQLHFKALAGEHRLEQPYTPVHQFLIPFDEPTDKRYTTAYYDSAEDRFLYIQDDDVWSPADPLLGAVIDGSAYFYHPQSVEVFRTDVVSGLISHRYRLMLKRGEFAITQCSAVPGGVKVVQEVIDGHQGYSLEYLLTDTGVFLNSLTLGMDANLENVLGQTPTLTDWKPLLGNYVDWPDVRSSARFETSVWQLAAFVAVHWHPEQGRSDMSWVRSSDGLIVRPLPQHHHARGWKDSEKALNQSSLLAPGGTEGDVFVVYKHNSSRLCVQRRSLLDGQVVLSSQWTTLKGLKNVVETQEGCLALTDEGLFYDVTPTGQLQLGGLTEVWFKDRPRWWTQLPAVVADVPSTTLALIGLSNARGDGRLCAWYLDGRLVLADLGHGKEVRVLGATPDNASVWLFDIATGELYRQSFVDDKQLPNAFGDGTRLLAPDALPAPRPLWNPWTFAEVTRRGASLLATTVEGVQMELNHQEPPLITGVDSQWVREHADALVEHLKVLVDSTQRCALLLSVAHPVRQQWFVSSSGRLIDAANVPRPESSVALGTQRYTNVLLFDATDGLLRRYPLINAAGPLGYVQRNADTLTVESNLKLDDVLPLIPDDVSTLILRLGHNGAKCRLSKAAWRRLESVIVDCRPPLGKQATTLVKLDWALDSAEQLIVSLVDEHLVMLDPVTCHSLIFRDAYAKDVTLRGRIVVAIKGYRSMAVADLVSALEAETGTAGSVLFKDVASLRQSEPAMS